MKTAVVGLTRGGQDLAVGIAAGLTDCVLCEVVGGVMQTVRLLWKKYDGLICIMAAGIVVRAIAPLCRDKKTDPCVLVLDEKGRFVISLLSGHLGGGNDLAHRVAAITGGVAVVTTASDVTGHTALDLWAVGHTLWVRNPQSMTRVAARLVNEGELRLFVRSGCGRLPDDFRLVSSPQQADVIVSPYCADQVANPDALVLCPRTLILGLGCNRGTESTDFEAAVTEICAAHGLDRTAIAGLASIDLKKNETGLVQFARENNLPLTFYEAEELNRVEGIAESAAVLAATGARGVAEPAAMLAAGDGEKNGKLLVRKMKWRDVTAAVAEKKLGDLDWPLNKQG